MTFPAYLVRGGDPVLRAEAARSLVRSLVGDEDPALVVEEHEPGDDDTSTLADAAQTPPFLTSRRVVVGRDVTAYSSEALQALLAYLASPLDTTSLVLVAGEGGRLSPKLVAAVKKVGRVVDAGVPTKRAARQSWVADQVRQGPVRLDTTALALVDDHLGDDVGRLRNLLETLGAAYGKGSRLGVDDVEPFLGEAGSVPPWELTDAIEGGDAAAAVAALHRMTRAGERHPLQVMAILHGYVSRMLRLDGAGIADPAVAAEALGVKGSTYPVRKALEQGRRLGHDGVAEAVRLLAEADLDLRGAKGWPDELVLEVLVARLSRLSPRRPRH
jgi:DNA polymerase-3 subunit delta